MAPAPSHAAEPERRAAPRLASPAAVGRTQRALAAAGRLVETHVYPGTQHWFFERDRPEYGPRAAGRAWRRTVTFLRDQLG